MQSLDDWIRLLDMCSGLPMSAPQCRSLWESVIYICVAVALVITGWLAWRWMGGGTHPKTAKPASPAGPKINPGRPVSKKYDDSNPDKLIEDITDPHLKEKIRRELEQRRLKNMQAR